MPGVCIYFQVHQPCRLRRYSVFDTAPTYFDAGVNGEIIRRVAARCYLPATRLLLDLIRATEGRFRLALSLSGVVIDQLQADAPEALAPFQALAATGCVEFLGETYHHSLAFLYSRQEFAEQVRLHRVRVRDLFGRDPHVFRNTELVYNNDVAEFVARLGFCGILAEGVDTLLGRRPPTVVYRAPCDPPLPVLLRHYRLSDDIAFRFRDRTGPEGPLTAEKFAAAINEAGEDRIVNLFLDFETFGEHHPAESGILDFLAALPAEVLRHPGNAFLTPSEAIDAHRPADVYDAPLMISWADSERDLSAWLGNAMQANAMHEAFRLEQAVKAAADPDLLRDWRLLLSSDHFYYMCTKYFADGAVHQHFNPYDSPYDSYINYMNVLDNLRSRTHARA